MILETGKGGKGKLGDSEDPTMTPVPSPASEMILNSRQQTAFRGQCECGSQGLPLVVGSLGTA